MININIMVSHQMVFKVFLLLFFLLSVHPTRAQIVDETTEGQKEMSTDSVWFDRVTGRRMHIQRLGGVDTLVTVRPNAFAAIVKDLSINATLLAWDHFVQDREWARVTSNVLSDHFSHKPVFDNDSFSGNQFSHPYHGGMFYNAARHEGLSYGVSLLYPLLGSATWEWLCETNPPSVNDLLSTGIGGAALGEVAHRASDIFFDNSKRGSDRVVREIIGSLLNPVRAVHRLFSGEMWRVSSSRGKRIQPQPYSFEVGLGYRGMHELKGERQFLQVPYVEFDFTYGQRFNAQHKSKPFDWFSISLLTNLSDRHPTVGNFEVSGRLADRQVECKHNWNLDIGFYQNVKYIDHYSQHEQHPHNFSMISEAVSFGGGLYAERESEKVCFTNDFMLSAVVFGGTPRDYYPKRRYSYASGASIRYNTSFFINQHASVGNKFYFARLYSLHGYDQAEIDKQLNAGIELNCWGDQGNHSVFTNNFYIQYNLFKNTRLNLDYQIYYRSSNYSYFPSVKAKSHEWKMGIIYSI